MTASFVLKRSPSSCELAGDATAIETGGAGVKHTTVTCGAIYVFAGSPNVSPGFQTQNPDFAISWLLNACDLVALR